MPRLLEITMSRPGYGADRLKHKHNVKARVDLSIAQDNIYGEVIELTEAEVEAIENLVCTMIGSRLADVHLAYEPELPLEPVEAAATPEPFDFDSGRPAPACCPVPTEIVTPANDGGKELAGSAANL